MSCLAFQVCSLQCNIPYGIKRGWALIFTGLYEGKKQAMVTKTRKLCGRQSTKVLFQLIAFTILYQMFVSILGKKSLLLL
jgi:hypothetical protein